MTREDLKEDPLLSGMMLFRRNRLSITKVTEEEYRRILELAGEQK